jgi:ubiquinone/menaquinone biosynthesis C-methylase UbiE
MPDAREVYQLHPEEYDELVRCEDHTGNLLRAIGEVVRLDAADVVELGAGTGRVTTLLAPHVRSIHAFDNAAPMLQVARRHLDKLGLSNWQVDLADNARLPIASASADLSIAGWTHGHQTVWLPDGWRAPIEAAVGEMLRVLRPGGTAIVIETMGTGHVTPFDPPPELARYYAMLTDDFGFASRWIRTDYEFASAANGARLVGFFFGEQRARCFAATGSRILPECTGIWWRRSTA